MKPNGLYRRIGGFEMCDTWQCLSCKGFYISYDDERYKFCPQCSTELKSQFLKKNKRFPRYSYIWKQHFPHICFYVCQIHGKWELNGQIQSEDFVGNREKQGCWPEFPQIFKERINNLKKQFTDRIIKAVIVRWNGSTKEIIVKHE